MERRETPFSLWFGFSCNFTKRLEGGIMSDTSIFSIFRYVLPWYLSAQAIHDNTLKYFHLLKFLSPLSFI